MEEDGRTTAWLAKQCGVEVTSLRNLLRGRKPSSPVLKLMAIALNLNEQDLIGPTDKVS